MNMDEYKETYRRKLPHWQPQNAIFFITFRLAHSLPQPILQELRAEQERQRRIICAQFSAEAQPEELYRLAKKSFGAYDAWLDKCLEESPRWLAQEPIAQIVMQELHRLDTERYDLIAFCIMPNHGHLLMDTTGFNQVSAAAGTTHTYPLADTLRLLKGRTARYCNQALERAGDFWHSESYDHVVRDEQELERVFFYILNNPVKAQLVSEWESWPYTYAK